MFFQIEVIADLPVGENLHDHFFVPIDFVSDEVIGVDENMTESVLVKLEHRLLGSGNKTQTTYNISLLFNMSLAYGYCIAP